MKTVKEVELPFSGKEKNNTGAKVAPSGAWTVNRLGKLRPPGYGINLASENLGQLHTLRFNNQFHGKSGCKMVDVRLLFSMVAFDFSSAIKRSH